MKLFHLFILCIACINTCLLISSASRPSIKKYDRSFTIQELDYNDPQEVAETCQLFIDPIIQYKTGNISPDYLQERILRKNKSKIYLVCKSPNDQVCGVLQLKIDNETTEFKTIATHKNYRNMGIASALMKSAELMIPRSTEIIHLRVQRNNLSAIACYKKAGFKIEPCTQCKADCWATILSLVPCIDISNFSYGMIKQLR